MLVLGHLGIGRGLALPWFRRWPPLAFFAGTLLPDAIDKPLYYALSTFTGRRGLELGLLSGTRTVGHTLVLVILVALVARWRHSTAWRAMAIGMLTHLGLDVVNDFLGIWSGVPHDPGSIPGYAAVVWPAMGWQFPVAPFSNAAGHVERLMNPVTVAGELLGALILSWEAWRHRTTIASRLRLRT
jgi:hypothetical protein